MFVAGFFSCSKPIPEATLEKPAPMENETVTNNAKRKELDPSDVKEYFDVKTNPSTANFAHEKYSALSQATWQCHDPRLFQDPDTGRYYVYSTGWANGVELRSSDDLVHWAKHGNSPLWDPKDVSISYHHMHWDDDFLKWVGYVTNDGTAYNTNWYKATARPNSWAPTIVKQNGKYYMLHGIITDCLSFSGGKHPAAAITMAIADSPEGPFIPAKDYNPELYSNSTLARYVWNNKNAQNTEIGYWGSYNTANSSWANGFGCIDPEFVMNVATGELKTFKIGKNTCYAVTYGSWKNGIALIYVDAETFKPVATVAGTSTFNGKKYRVGDEMDAPVDSIEGNCGVLIAGGKGAAYEGAQVIFNSKTGYYYVFVSMGDLSFEYRVGVGRSKNVDGPYTDTSGQSMVFKTALDADSYHSFGGKIIGAAELQDEYGYMAPGGQSIFTDKDKNILFACHTRTNFRGIDSFCLKIHSMFFTEDGWPVLNQNEYWNDYDGAKEGLTPLTAQDISGTYDSILTVRGSSKGSFKTGVVKVNAMHVDDARPTASKELTLNEDGSISGSYTGSWSLAKDGSSVTLTLKDTEGASIGTFKGYALKAYDWARKGENVERHTITFTTLDATTTGEYFWGNKR